MTTDAISNSYAALFGTMRKAAGPRTADDAEDFAAYLPNDDEQVSPATDMTARILRVGLQRYTEERQEVAKAMRVLDIVRTDSTGEVREELDKIIAALKAEPPVDGEDAVRRIKAHIDKLPPTGDLKPRMLKMLDRIKELMALPDDALARLEKEQQAKKSADASTVFAANEA